MEDDRLINYAGGMVVGGWGSSSDIQSKETLQLHHRSLLVNINLLAVLDNRSPDNEGSTVCFAWPLRLSS